MKKEIEDTYDPILNVGVVFKVHLNDINDILEIIDNKTKVVFVKKSLKALWIKEGEQND